MKALKWGLPLAIFAVLVGFLFVGLYRDPREVPSPLIDKPAPAFSLPDLLRPGEDPEAPARRLALDESLQGEEDRHAADDVVDRAHVGDVIADLDRREIPDAEETAVVRQVGQVRLVR